MKEYLRQIIAQADGADRARNVAREYLQARILEALQDGGAFSDWAFLGGTALRFLYGMPRFSEDLGFSLARAGLADDFTRRMQAVKADLASEGYRVSIKAKVDKTVKFAFIRFEGLLYELGLSPHLSEVISVKVEIDTNPPDGAGMETTVVRRHCLLNLQHHDKASLLAGKIHALLMRPYAKGRDLYDLVWYLSDRSWPAPNLVMLNHALAQTGWGGDTLEPGTWRRVLLARLRDFDFGAVVTDVMPFVERVADLDLINLGVIKGLLGE